MTSKMVADGGAGPGEARVEVDELRAQYTLLRSLADKVPAMLAYWGADLRCRFANRDYVRWFGVEPEALLGHHIAELLGPLYALNQPYIEGALRGEEQQFEREIPDPGGGPPRYSLAHYSPDVVGGVVKGFFVLVTDITSHKRAQEAQQRLDRQSMDRLASLGTLASGLAHEINNPLGVTLANLDVVLAGLAAGKVDLAAAQAALVDAREGARRVSAVIQGMGLLGRGRAEVTTLVDVDETLTDSLAVAANTYRFRARLQSSIASQCLIRGDPAQLSQVFIHLLMNAAQALPTRGPEENWIHVDGRREGEWVSVTFSDNGHGIPPESQDRIFDPFFTTKRLEGGVGLGLSISRTIVEAFGGTLTFERPLEGSSLFRVRLPVASVREQRGTPAVPPGPPTSPPPVAATSAGRAHLLIIDDEPLVTTSLRRVLARDYEVDVSNDSQLALTRLRGDTDYDVILCDMMMPGLTGAELYAQVARDRPGLLARFVFMTGGAFTDEVRAFLSTCQRPVVDKPFNLAALKNVVSTCAAGRAPSDPVAAVDPACP